MKHFSNTIKLAFFLPLATVILSSCDGGGGTEDLDVRIAIAEALTAGQATVSEVTAPAGATNQDWMGFTITFTGGVDGGSYTTSAAGNQTAVWLASGSWKFTDDSGTKITRDNKEVINLAANATDLNLTFTVDDTQEGSRIKVVNGQWVFKCKF